MNEQESRERRRRRSRAEADQLVAEYEASGLSRREFSRTHGVALNTLNRYCGRRRKVESDGARWLAVELSDSSRSGGKDRGSGLWLHVANGRRIEIGRGFDAHTLEQLLRVVERA